MPKISAGILLYRKGKSEIEVLLVHPGGPFFARKDAGAWSIPKGEVEEGESEENYLDRAKREFNEETGFVLEGDFVPLGHVKQKGGKVVHAFAIEGTCDAKVIKSNTFEVEWPPHSGAKKEFPEVDRAAWFPIAVAKEKINPAQTEFLEALVDRNSKF